MGKCLVTKLNGTVNNQSLLRIGELRFEVRKVSSPNQYSQGFMFNVNKETTLEIIGDGYFTDKTLVENKGKTMTLSPSYDVYVYVSNGDFQLAILNKYSLVRVNDYGEWGNGAQQTGFINKTLDLDNLKTLTALTSLNLYNTQVSGNVGDLKTSTALTSLNLSSTQVSGNVGDLKTLTALTSLHVRNNTTLLTYNISDFALLPKLTNLTVERANMTGDLAELPDSCRFVSMADTVSSTLTWGTRSSSAKVIAIKGNATISGIDKMLQDQAKCQVGFTSGEGNMYKTIECKGTRTSASDAAVQALQSKGYTVSITPA